LDEEYLLQIVSNLVGNAFDAGATQVWVEARREGQNLVLRVANNGTPYLKKIWERFLNPSTPQRAQAQVWTGYCEKRSRDTRW